MQMSCEERAEQLRVWVKDLLSEVSELRERCASQIDLSEQDRQWLLRVLAGFPRDTTAQALRKRLEAP